MRKSAVTIFVLFFVASSTGYVGHTMLVGASGDDRCDHDSVNSLNYTNQLQNNTLVFEGVFCAPNTGYIVEDTGIEVENSEIETVLMIDGPSEDVLSGMAITPMKFEEKEKLEEGTYTVTEKIKIEGVEVEEDEFEVTIESESSSQGLAPKVISWFRNLF